MCPVRGVICSQDKMENVSFRAIWYQQQQQQQPQQQQQQPAAAATSSSSHSSSSNSSSSTATISSIWLVFRNLGFWRTSPQQRIKEYLLCVRSGALSAAKTKWKMLVSGLFGISSSSLQQQQASRPASRPAATSSSSHQQQQPPAAAATSSHQQQHQQQQQPPAAAAQHQYLLFGWFFETLVFDEHRRNKELELKNIFYVSGPGRYLQPRQNGKC